MRTRLTLTILCGLMTLPATQAHAAVPAISAGAALAHLNAQRAHDGLPAGVSEDPSLDDACLEHDNYMAINGGPVHGEDPTRPGATEAGGDYSGIGEVLATSGFAAWDDLFGSPWHDAPLHELVMFAPAVSSAGYADEQGFTCLRVRSAGSPAAGVYSRPGPGATNVPTTTDASGEGPYSPADVAGVSDVSGRNLLLWRVGGSTDVAGAVLRGPSGAVAVRTVDGRSATPDGGTFGFGGAAVVPIQPLEPGSAYGLDVTFADGTPYHVDFRTEDVDPLISVRGGVDARGTLLASPSTVAPASSLRVTATGPDGTERAMQPTAGTDFALTDPAGGTWHVCAAAGGSGTGFSARTSCVDVVVPRDAGSAGGTGSATQSTTTTQATTPSVAPKPRATGRGPGLQVSARGSRLRLAFTPRSTQTRTAIVRTYGAHGALRRKLVVRFRATAVRRIPTGTRRITVMVAARGSAGAIAARLAVPRTSR